MQTTTKTGALRGAGLWLAAALAALHLGLAQAADPAVALERVRLLRSQNRQSEGFVLLANLPPAPGHTTGDNTLWSERRNYFLDALQAGNWRAAYDAMDELRRAHARAQAEGCDISAAFDIPDVDLVIGSAARIGDI